MVEDMGLVEGPLVTSNALLGTAMTTFEHPETMTSSKPVRCPGCAGVLAFQGTALVVKPVGRWP